MSTYSSTLRLELIGTGEQAGTWGTTTNTNLGTLLESAITGYVSVSITSANQALTVLNGVADQSRNAVIALSTTTGANFAVYAPPVSKTYIIYNASSYTATIYNSTVAGNTTAAGVGVAVPAGKTMTLWTDGTNFSAQNTHLGSLSLATALPVSSGGTGATSLTANNVLLGNGTSAPQVVAPGTAGNVLTSNGTTWASSAPATTPPGGADTQIQYNNSGVFAGSANFVWNNATSALQVTGTEAITANSSTAALQVSQSGAGLGVAVPTGAAVVGDTTSRLAGYRLQSIGTNGGDFLTQRWAAGTGGGFIRMQKSRGAAVGTQAAVQSGDTLGTVTFDGDDGTTFGSAASVVAVAAATATSGSTPGALSLRTTASGSTTPTERIHVDSAGNAGFGVTPSAWGSTWKAIELGNIGTTISSLTTGNPQTYIASNAYYNGSNWIYKVTNYASLITLGIGGIGVSVAASGTAGNTVSFTDIFAVDGNGDLSSPNRAASVGYKGIPQNAKTASYTLALADMGYHISITTGGVVIPANGSVAFPIGAAVTIFNNSASTQTISITTDTLRQAGTTNTGTRTLAAYGVATVLKVASTVWVVSGNVT